MRNIYCFVLLFLAVNFGLTAQSNSRQHDFSIGTSVGYVWGAAEEIVYQDGASDEMLSNLLWDLRPLMYFGVNWDYSFGKPNSKVRFFADGVMKFCGPQVTGYMQDRDWDYKDVAKTGDEGWLTNYSVHSNQTTAETYLFKHSLGAAFWVSDDITLKTYLAYSTMNFSFESTGGSLLYYDDSEFLDESLAEVTYDQFWNVIFLGFSFCGTIDRHFSIELSLKISPYLLWVSTLDNHLLREIEVRNNLFGGLAFEPVMVFTFKQNELLSWNLAILFRNIIYVRGDSTYNFKKEHRQETYENIGGAGYSAVDISLNMGFNITELISRIRK